MQRSQDQNRQEFSIIAIGMDLLVLARQMAQEGAGQTHRGEVEGGSSREAKAHGGGAEHEHDGNSPLPDDDAPSFSNWEGGVHVERGHTSAGPLGTIGQPEVPLAHMEVGQRGLVGWGTPASLNGLLNAISELPSQWVMRFGDPAASSSHNLWPTLSEQAGSHLNGPGLSTPASDPHAAASLHGLSGGAQLSAPSASLFPAGGSQDESDTRLHVAQSAASYAGSAGFGNLASQSPSDALSRTTRDSSMSLDAATARVNSLGSQFLDKSNYGASSTSALERGIVSSPHGPSQLEASQQLTSPLSPTDNSSHVPNSPAAFNLTSDPTFSTGPASITATSILKAVSLSASPALPDPAHTASSGAAATDPAPTSPAPAGPGPASPALPDPVHTASSGATASGGAAATDPAPTSPAPADPVHAASHASGSTSPDTTSPAHVVGQAPSSDLQSEAGSDAAHMPTGTPQPSLPGSDHSPDSQFTPLSNPEIVADLRSKFIVISNPSAEDAPNASGQHGSEMRGFADHRLVLIDYMLEGQGKVHQSPDTAYSVATEVTYGSPGSGVTAELASSLLDFMTKLNADHHDGPNVTPSHDPPILIHAMDHHDTSSTSSNPASPVIEQNHLQDFSIYHTNAPNHASPEDLATLHHFDIHHG